MVSGTKRYPGGSDTMCLQGIWDREIQGSELCVALLSPQAEQVEVMLDMMEQCLRTVLPLYTRYNREQTGDFVVPASQM